MSQENNFIPEQENYKPLSPFRLFVKSNFPFIENTFEALDNYGLYCKIVEYLNTVIENENTVESNVTELYNAFVSLNTYVSNYFDNLDVQEEINNKLDEMVTSGELEQIINDNLFNDLQSQINSLASGSPLVASSTSEMTDTTRIYVNTTDGKWYYYNGESWTIGGTYQATGIGENSVDYKELTSKINTQIKITQPVLTYTDGAYIGASTGDISSGSGAADYSYTNLITLKKGSAIGFTSGGATTTAALAPYDEESSRYRTALVANTSNAENNYYYVNNGTRDIKVSICGKKTYIKNVRLYNTIIGLDNIDNDYNLKLGFDDLTVILKDSDYDDYESNKFINYITGNTATLNGLQCTDYIDIIPNQPIKLEAIKVFKASPDARGLAFYNDNKEFISGVQFPNSTTIETTTPKNARYMRTTRAFGMIAYYKSLKTIIDSNYVAENKIDNISGLDLYKSFLHVGVIGDSLASGASAYKTDGVEHWLDNYDYSWPQFMARSSGNTYYNFSKGGLTTKTWLTDAKGYPLASDGNHTCEAYIMGLGVNDINYVDLGTSSDIDISDYTNNADSFYGNYAGIIQRLQILSPKAKFFLLTLPRTRRNKHKL